MAESGQSMLPLMNSFIDRDYLSASLEAGKELLAEHTNMTDPDQMLFDLAKFLRESNEYQGKL
jgi:hypothetical protein